MQMVGTATVAQGPFSTSDGAFCLLNPHHTLSVLRSTTVDDQPGPLVILRPLATL